MASGAVSLFLTAEPVPNYRSERKESVMSNDRFASAHEMVREYQELEKLMADPSIHEDQGKARQLGRRYAQLGPVVAGFNEWKSAAEDLEAAKEMALDDPDFASEIPALEETVERTATRLEELLLPRDPNDDRDVIIEVKAGAGGDESALFAGDLVRMYQRYAENMGWRFEILEQSQTELGGIKEVVARVAGEGVFARLKYESGVHRVQRVPETESGGRIHTSAATVAVLPEAQDVDIQINPGDLRIDTMRASGSGGQHVNTTDSAVRILHIPTGLIVVSAEKSQHRNREIAMQVLKTRLFDLERQRIDGERSADRKAQVGSGDRSERIRTYNFPQGRLTDHRINLTLYSLGQVMAGDLDTIIDALQSEAQAALLAEMGA